MNSGFIWVGWWHPGFAAFLGSVSASVVAFIHADTTPDPPCGHCDRPEARLTKSHREIDETRQALLELAPPPKDPQ